MKRRLLPPRFTLSQFQHLYEGPTLDKRNFRKKVLSFGLARDAVGACVRAIKENHLNTEIAVENKQRQSQGADFEDDLREDKTYHHELVETQAVLGQFVP